MSRNLAPGAVGLLLGLFLTVAAYWYFGTAGDAAIAALVAAIIGSVIATLGFWITFKTSTEAVARGLQLQAAIKKAEFRQQWIENLRRSLADFVAKVSASFQQGHSGLSPDVYEYLTEKTEYIELLLNHNEPDSAGLVAAMRQTVDSASSSDPEKLAKFHQSRTRVNELSRKILKAEWEKLKSELETTNRN